MKNLQRKEQLIKIIKDRDHVGLKKIILENTKFKYEFSVSNFWTDIHRYRDIQRFVFFYERKLKIPQRNSLIYKISLNLFDNNEDVRNYYYWKCQKCKIDCKNDKDIIDVHRNDFGFFGNSSDIIEKVDLTVYCRLCHYNINPKKHFNLNITDEIKNRIYKLRSALNS